jgi:pimeloyl-ACP methyl ester carboxylesterase
MQHIILLHGAIGSKEQLFPLAEVLKQYYTVHALNFTGHGGENIPAEPFSIELFTKDVLRYMQQHNIDLASIFGYSMGGYVAMYLAKNYPEKISRVITLATKFYWDEAVATNEVKMLNAEIIEQKLPAFAKQLKQRHAPIDWKLVLQKVAGMLIDLGINNTLQEEDYFSVTTPSLLLLGDRDKMVTLDETVTVYKKLPNAQLGVLPKIPHPIEQVNIDMLSYMVHQFLKQTF